MFNEVRCVVFNSYYPDIGEWTEGQAYAARGSVCVQN